MADPDEQPEINFDIDWPDFRNLPSVNNEAGLTPEQIAEIDRQLADL